MMKKSVAKAKKVDRIKENINFRPSVKIRAIWGHLKNNPVKSTIFTGIISSKNLIIEFP
jgi:hypothetical protein